MRDPVYIVRVHRNPAGLGYRASVQDMSGPPKVPAQGTGSTRLAAILSALIDAQVPEVEMRAPDAPEPLT